MKKILAASFLILLATLVGITLYYRFFYLQSEDDSMNYTTYSADSIPFTLKYPEEWEVEGGNGEEGLTNELIVLKDSHFSVNVFVNPLNSRNAECSPENPCGVVYPDEILSYSEGQYELVQNGLGEVIFSIEAGNTISDNQLKGDIPEQGEANYVYQKRGEGVSQNVLSDDSEQQIYIYYILEDEYATQNWKEYKVILREMLESIERV